jgi:hypothetical protein
MPHVWAKSAGYGSVEDMGKEEVPCTVCAGKGEKSRPVSLMRALYDLGVVRIADYSQRRDNIAANAEAASDFEEWSKIEEFLEGLGRK